MFTVKVIYNGELYSQNVYFTVKSCGIINCAEDCMLKSLVDVGLQALPTLWRLWIPLGYPHPETD